jgi:hypothetical protein
VACWGKRAILLAVAYAGMFFGGGFHARNFLGGQQIQLRTEGSENRDLGAVAP